jgi:hypothetical protein
VIPDIANDYGAFSCGSLDLFLGHLTSVCILHFEDSIIIDLIVLNFFPVFCCE